MKFHLIALREFWDFYDALPGEIQKQAAKQYRLFCEDPSHHSLRLKQVFSYWSSARVLADWRQVAGRTVT